MASQSYQLVVNSGPNIGKVYPLTQSEIVIGRDPTNDIVINDAEVSRKHARLMLQAGSYVLEDLGSTNGTYVGGQKLLCLGKTSPWCSSRRSLTRMPL
jgi:pSer/pThr/pTyr-binding forkhead associated (FHA) protein